MDIDFKIECYNWLRQIRGDDYLARLAVEIACVGPEVVMAEVIHPTMSDDEKEVYRAVIEHVSNLPLWSFEGKMR